jgi:hypothetical protein
MKIILTMILSCFVVTSMSAQAAPASTQQAQADTQPMTENPPVPGSGQTENPKDPKQNDQSAGAIVRKHDTPVSLDPAKTKKVKKAEKKQKVEEHTDPQTTESTD